MRKNPYETLSHSDGKTFTTFFFLFLESKSSLLCSKETATGPYPVELISSPHPVLIIQNSGGGVS
jgi:hypothetical protein